MNTAAQLEQSLSDLPADFDPVWYRQTYSDVALLGMDSAEHYLWIGRKLGRRPNAGPGAPAPAIEAAAPAPAPVLPPAIAPELQPALVVGAADELPAMPQDAARWMRGNVRIARQRAVPLAPHFRSFNPGAMNLHWIVPGELPIDSRQARIFALIRELEYRGHNQWIWIQPPVDAGGEAEFRDALNASGLLGNRTILRILPEDIFGISGDAVIATDVWSCFPASAMPLFKARFRMVQWLNPDGQADGTGLAFGTHAFGLDLMSLCAGPAIEHAIAAPGKWTRHWPPFAHGATFFVEAARRVHKGGDTLKLAVDLGKADGSEVAADLALDVLDMLARQGLRFTAHLFGQSLSDPNRATFPYVDHGPLDPGARGDLFRLCDLALALATCLDNATHAEMLACGLETIGLKHPCQGDAEEEGLHLVSASSAEIADKIAEVVTSMEAATTPRLHRRPTTAATADAVETAIRDGLSVNNEAVPLAVALTSAAYEHKAAVIIPTWNGGTLFKDVLEALVSQIAPWSFEVLVVDSGSTDETLGIIGSFEHRGVRLHQIPNSAFQHGRTRNLAISLTSAEFIAVLTQDATPANEYWLANLVKAFDKGSHVAGVFGAHAAYPEATRFISMGIEEHFNHFNRLPHVAEWTVDYGDPIPFGSIAWQNWIHYYSDNNSCMRRSVWEKIPYPNVDWGEDQVWAWEIVKQGYQKAYAHDAVVYHSHNLTVDQQKKVSAIEGEFWLRHFGYRFESSADQVRASTDYLRKRTMDLARVQGIADKVRDEQIELERVAVNARYLGQTRALLEFYGSSC